MTRLVDAETDGERLAHEEILGFVQLLIVAGQETTTNLINNAILCLMENPEQRERLERRIDLSTVGDRGGPALPLAGEPREALHVHGPRRLSICFEPGRQAPASVWVAPLSRPLMDGMPVAAGCESGTAADASKDTEPALDSPHPVWPPDRVLTQSSLRLDCRAVAVHCGPR